MYIKGKTVSNVTSHMSICRACERLSVFLFWPVNCAPMETIAGTEIRSLWEHQSIKYIKDVWLQMIVKWVVEH